MLEHTLIYPIREHLMNILQYLGERMHNMKISRVFFCEVVSLNVGPCSHLTLVHVPGEVQV